MNPASEHAGPSSDGGRVSAATPSLETGRGIAPCPDIPRRSALSARTCKNSRSPAPPPGSLRRDSARALRMPLRRHKSDCAAESSFFRRKVCSKNAGRLSRTGTSSSARSSCSNRPTISSFRSSTAWRKTQVMCTAKGSGPRFRRGSVAATDFIRPVGRRDSVKTLWPVASRSKPFRSVGVAGGNSDSQTKRAAYRSFRGKETNDSPLPRLDQVGRLRSQTKGRRDKCECRGHYGQKAQERLAQHQKQRLQPPATRLERKIRRQHRIHASDSFCFAGGRDFRSWVRTKAAFVK